MPEAPVLPTAPAGDSPITSFADLQRLLVRDHVMHEVHQEAEEVVISTQKGELDSVLFMRWRKQAGVLEYIQPLPFEVPTESTVAMESAICRLNFSSILVGCLVFAAKVRRVFFRATLPILPRGELLPEEIRAYFRLCVNTAAEFLPELRALAEKPPASAPASGRAEHSPPDVLKTYNRDG